MYSSLFEVSQWCKAVDLLGKRRKITLISCFGERRNNNDYLGSACEFVAP
ncbi:putative H(+)-transporting two-sector ATPase [Helianthus annuus]|uniref:H(+)-transporting two-sector ATPase n=1 Tax=Helianthus annuus TaxID=4232 RepID=A0A9K3HHU0_HELAN|nr:putative H(+)-transporting two-sector ATPase [Helianthus annuus]KAJ0678871.1 putative H(+)-transporting two-sector ATPase [Helianthus annuus]KAJ0863385.1 putative H(+)-transporting two-sector ATPase [Helianthus annuus]